MITKEVLKNIYDDWCGAYDELYKVSTNYIKERLNLLPNNEIYFDFELTIPYYGEYDSNPDSKVYRVYVKDGEIHADTEDIDGYDITCAKAWVLYDIAIAISSISEK